MARLISIQNKVTTVLRAALDMLGSEHMAAAPGATVHFLNLNPEDLVPLLVLHEIVLFLRPIILLALQARTLLESH